MSMSIVIYALCYYRKEENVRPCDKDKTFDLAHIDLVLAYLSSLNHKSNKDREFYLFLLDDIPFHLR